MTNEIVTLQRGSVKFEFSHEHAQNILNHPIQESVKAEMKYKLPSDSDWEFKKGELKKKPAKEKK